MKFTEAVILFHSSNNAMWAKSVLEDERVSCKLTTVPRELSSDCGYCIKVKYSLKDRVKSLLGEKHVEIDKIIAI